MEASSAQEALSLLHAAQCNSSNWISDQNGHMTPVPNNAHLFVRIVLYDAVKQQMSTLHVIDLAGNQRLSTYQSDCSSQKHQEMLAINQQLLSLSKLVSELSRLSTSHGQLPFPPLAFCMHSRVVYPVLYNKLADNSQNGFQPMHLQAC